MSWEEGEYWWDKDFQAIVFEAKDEERRLLFQVTGSWLNDKLNTPDDKDTALANFKKHQKPLTRLATLALDHLEKSQSGRYVIPKGELQKWAL